MKSGRGPDWLPRASDEPFITDARVTAFINTHYGSDWFLRYAKALHDRDLNGDGHVGRMVGKVHGFPRDFIPSGFTGRWSHIDGNHVMTILMCHTKTQAVSRHRAKGDAHVNFERLEEWMRQGRDWREAAQACDDTGKTPQIVYSSAGLVAFLILAHPGSKLRDRVASVRAGGMAGDRDTFVVGNGFWEGLTGDDLEQCFHLEPTRSSGPPLLADCTRLFGEDFLDARRDIRPFLPPFLKYLSLPK